MKRVVSVGAALLMVLALSFFLGAAQAEQISVRLNERVKVEAAEAEFTFIATSNNLYSIRGFGAGEDVEISLYLAGEEEPVARGEGASLEVRLVTDSQYTLRVKNGQGAQFEIMRAALGRCFDRPTELDGHISGYGKAIARAYDTHWYRYTAWESGTYLFRTTSGIDTVGYLTDIDGEVIGYSDDALPPYEKNLAIRANLTKGQVCYLRISAKDDQTGAYKLYVRTPAQLALPQSISIPERQIDLREGEEYALIPVISPENTELGVSWVSTNPQIATVTRLGVVAAKAAGEADVIAYVDEDTQAICHVTVASIPVEGLEFVDAPQELPRKSQRQLTVRLTPENASNQQVRYASDNPQVASVDENGLVTARAEGQALITATSLEGGHSARLSLTVTQPLPVYRALVMGEQRYTNGKKERIGATNTTQGIADLLGVQDYDGQRYQVTMRIDSTKREFVESLGAVFAGAEETDVSLIYINCHGGLRMGEPYLEFHDGSSVTARQLEQLTRKIPGRVILLIDCCNSGGFLSAREARQFNSGMVQILTGEGATSLLQSKYLIMTSASVSQNSYRFSSDGENEAAMATAFARSLCEAGGFDLVKDRKIAMRADPDKDKDVTLFEAYQYVRARVHNYLKVNPNAMQDVQVFPRGSGFPLFKR